MQLITLTKYIQIRSVFESLSFIDTLKGGNPLRTIHIYMETGIINNILYKYLHNVLLHRCRSKLGEIPTCNVHLDMTDS